MQARITLLLNLGSSSEILSYDNPEVNRIQSNLCGLSTNYTGTMSCVTENVSRSVSFNTNFEKVKSRAILIGKNLGQLDHTQRLRAGQTDSLRTLWVADTAVLAVVASGTGQSSKVCILVFLSYL